MRPRGPLVLLNAQPKEGIMKPKKNFTPPTLEDRIAAIHEEIDALIDKRVAELKADQQRQTGYNLPEGVIRQTLVARAQGCKCNEYKEFKRHSQ